MAMTCYTFVYRLEIVSTCAEMVQQHETKAIPARTVISRNAWIATVRDGTVYSSYTASLPCIKKKNSFNKLICVIQIFMRKYFMVQHYPQNIFNIELFPNYCIFLFFWL